MRRAATDAHQQVRVPDGEENGDSPGAPWEGLIGAVVGRLGARRLKGIRATRRPVPTDALYLRLGDGDGEPPSRAPAGLPRPTKQPEARPKCVRPDI